MSVEGESLKIVRGDFDIIGTNSGRQTAVRKPFLVEVLR